MKAEALARDLKQAERKSSLSAAQSGEKIAKSIEAESTAPASPPANADRGRERRGRVREALRIV